MKGFIRRAAASVCLGAGALSVVGCTQYRAHVDPCWPERYDFESKTNIKNTFDAQCANGHMFDQMLWNYDFERDKNGNPTDVLTPGGEARLKYIMRRRPIPDGRLYLQTANDLPPTVELGQYVEKRQDVDAARIAAVQKYLGTMMAGRAMPVAWEVAVIDPPTVGLPATVVGGAPTGATGLVVGAYSKLQTNFQGVFGTVSGFTTPVGGGGVAGGGGAGGGGGGAASGPGAGQQGGGVAQQGGGAPPSGP